MKKLIIVFLVLLMAGVAQATTYYMRNDGTNADPDCSESSACCAGAMDVSDHNAASFNGDDVIIMCAAGDPFTSTIIPPSSGSDGSPITYRSEALTTDPTTDPPDTEISSSSNGMVFDDIDWIIVDSIYFNGCGARWIQMYNDSDNNIIRNSKFYNTGGGVYDGLSLMDPDISEASECDSNLIYNNYFPDAPVGDTSCTYWDAECTTQFDAKAQLPTDCDCNTDPADMIRISGGDGNRIIGNVFGNSSHQSITEGQYMDCTNSIIRDNTVTNKMHSGISVDTYSLTALVENNLVLDSGTLQSVINPVKYSRNRTFEGDGIYSMGQDTIIRYNAVSDGNTGYYFGGKSGIYEGAPPVKGEGAAYYHNTIAGTTHAMLVTGNSVIAYSDNIVINNLIEGSDTYKIRNVADYNYGVGTENYFIRNMWSSSAIEYLFKNTSTIPKTLDDELFTTYPLEWAITNAGAATGLNGDDIDWHGSWPNFEGVITFTDELGHDFTLDGGQSAIDTAAPLTHTVCESEPCSGTSLTVDDGRFFFDGFGISGETADTIQVIGDGDPANFTTQITDRTGNVLTIPAGDSWEADSKIYICPGGVCFVGTAPDIGAYEFSGEEQNHAPSGTYTPGGNVTLYVNDTLVVSMTSTFDKNDTCASNDCDEDGDDQTYLWDFDGGVAAGNSTSADPGNTTFLSTAPATYNCSLTVTDEHGAYNTYTFDVFVFATPDVTGNSWDTDDNVHAVWNLDDAGSNKGPYDLDDNGTVTFPTGDKQEGAGAASFNGTDQWLSRDGEKYGSDDFGWSTTEAFTVCAWIKPDTSAAGGIFTKIGTDKKAVRVDYSSGNKIILYVGTTGTGEDWGEVETSTTALTDTQWYHVCAAFEDFGNTYLIQVYGDTEAGEVDYDSGTTALDWVGHDQDGDILIGANWAGGGRFGGLIDEVVVFNRKLTSAEMDLITAQTYPPSTATVQRVEGYSEDGYYGIGYDLHVSVVFTEPVTWTDGGDDDSYLEAEVGGTDLKLYHAYPASGTAGQTHRFSTGSIGGDAIVEGMNSDDLTINSIEDGDGSWDGATTTIPSGYNLDDTSAIIIDTASSTISDMYVCVSDGTEITSSRVYTVGDNVYLCLVSSDDNYFFDNGDLTELSIPTNSSLAFKYYSGIGTTKLIMYDTVAESDSLIKDVQITGTGDFAHGDVDLVDEAENEFSYTLPAVTIVDSGAIGIIPIYVDKNFTGGESTGASFQ